MFVCVCNYGRDGGGGVQYDYCTGEYAVAEQGKPNNYVAKKIYNYRVHTHFFNK